MTKLKPKPILNKLYLLIFAFVVLTAIIIEGCKKDNHAEQQATINDPAVIQAKSWYESTFPANNNKQSTQATTTSSDLSQLIKPDWQHNDSYTRFNKPVIEMPIDPSSKFNPSIKNKTTGWSSNQAYSRSSFILLNNGNGYDAYVMTLIADSAYLKNDLSKLDRNKYNKRDANYSGLVLYFTPKGKYVGGWRYKDGHIVSSGSPSGSGVKVQSTGNSKLKPMYVECWDYWLSSPSGDVMIYLFTYCSGGDGGTGSNGGDSGTGSSSGGEGSGGGDGSASSPTPPPPCNGAPPIIHSSGNLVVNNVPPDPYPGDGFPPPPTDPCTVELPADITNNVTDPCLKSMVNAAISNDIVYSLNESMVSIFNTTTNFNLNFIDAESSTFSTPTIDGTTDVDYVHFSTVSSTRQIIDAMDLRITLNKTGLSTASQEYVTATIMHEALHAYLTYSHTIVSQHVDMARNYISVMADQLLKLYPNLSPNDAKNLAWGGLEKDAGSLYTDLTQVEKSDIDVTNQYYKSGKLGNPCTR